MAESSARKRSNRIHLVAFAGSICNPALARTKKSRSALSLGARSTSDSRALPSIGRSTTLSPLMMPSFSGFLLWSGRLHGSVMVHHRAPSHRLGSTLPRKPPDRQCILVAVYPSIEVLAELGRVTVAGSRLDL